MDFSILSVSQPSSRKFTRVSFDRDYSERLKNGDSETEQHFVDYFGRLLRIKLKTRLRNTQTIEYLIQETFFRVFTALKLGNCLHLPEHIGALVNTVCQDLLMDLHDSKSGLQESLPDPPHTPDNFVNAESKLIPQDYKPQIRQVLEDFSARDRELFHMIFYEENDKDEVCRRFGVDRNYLQVIMRRAKMRLRIKLLDE